ncbi:LacI family transcriptional regulator [Glycomyces sp. A-F 0318]|nr:LacI family DNA-binding transcriptional regulator [Glycomyces amatae]MCD0446649.1 LacI family transcriptional regulator [Glycomyces amatae]
MSEQLGPRPAARQAGAGRAQRVTMADVAAKAGVSRTLVSLILRDQPGAGAATRDRVLRAADELGYRPDSAAQMLARGRSRTLGVMLDLDQPFHAEMVKAVYPIAERLGYDVLLSAVAPGRDERRALGALLGHRCEALVLLGSDADARLLASLAESAPTVVVGRKAGAPGVDSVRTAETKGVRQAVDHLVELGHRRIVHIDGGKGPGSSDRRSAYRAAMRRRGLAEEVRVIPGAHDEDAGIAAGTLLLGEESPPTAVLAANDRCALGLMHALRGGRVEVPGEVSVVGYDDSHLSHLSHINLTTVRQDTESIAEQAVRCAVERLEHAALPGRDVALDPKLIVRATTAPPRRNLLIEASTN